MKKILGIIGTLWFLILGMYGCQQIQLAGETAQSLGAKSEPDIQKSVDSTEIEMFMQNLGPDELKLLMASPNAPSPGLPINDMLFMVQNIDLTVMVDMVHGIGAKKIIDLVYAMKRLGCNKVKNDDGTFKFHIPEEHHYSDCTREDFDHLRIMVDLVNGVIDLNSQNLDKLISLVKADSLVPNTITDPAQQALEDARYVEKMAYMVVYMEDTEKLITMMDGVRDGRDIAYLVSLFSPNLVVPVTVEEIETRSKMDDIIKMVNIAKNIEDSTKLYELINGRRTLAGEEGKGEDQGQIDFLNKVKPMLDGPEQTSNDSTVCANDTELWSKKMTALMNGVETVAQTVTLLSGISLSKVPNMVDVMCRSNDPDAAPPHNNTLKTLIYVVEKLLNVDKMITVVNSADPANMAITLNAASAGSQLADDGITSDLDAAGKKLIATIDGVNDVTDLTYIINNISDPLKLSDLMNSVKISDVTKIATLMNAITGENAPTTKTDFKKISLRNTATGAGKLLNLMDFAYDVSTCSSKATELAYLLQNIENMSLMAGLVNDVSNSSNIVGFLNKVLATDSVSDSTLDDMVSLMNSMSIKAVPKLASVMNNLGDPIEHTACGFSLTNGNQHHELIAQLLAPASGVDKGVGYQSMVTLMNNIPDNDPKAQDGLAIMVKGVADLLIYNSSKPNITKREGMVRMIQTIPGQGMSLLKGSTSNPTADNVDFPGIGPIHLGSQIIGNASDLGSLINIMNGSELIQMAITVGCQDAVASPDFKTPCCKINQWKNSSQC